MKNTIFTIIIMINGSLLFGQDQTDSSLYRPVNNLHLNLLGDVSLLSIGYERIFFIGEKMFLTSKLGVGYNQEFYIGIAGSSWGDKYLTIPHHFTMNLGKTAHLFEFGLGGTIMTGNISPNYFLYPIIGWRFLPLNSQSFNFRVFCYLPFNGWPNDDLIPSYIGFNVGLSF